MNARRNPPLAPLAFGSTLIVFGLVLSALFALFAGCGLATSGLPNPDAGSACTSQAQCDDMDLCTVDTCSSAGVCVHTPLPDGPAPGVDQATGDCQQVVCTGGVTSSVADNTDVPPAPDMCTVESCNAGVPQHMSATDGTQCTLGTTPGTCTSGTCSFKCKVASDCPSKGACQIASCDGSTGTCTYTNVTDGTDTPGYTQIKGDCTEHVCLSGMDTAQPALADIPARVNDCGDPVCNGTTPTQSYMKYPSNTQCSTYMTSHAGFCDGAGHCDQCAIDTECTGTIDDCQHPSCSSGTCTTFKFPDGTPTTKNPVQPSGTCQQYLCEGGVATLMPLDTNLPTVTPTCQTAHCTNGVPSATNNPGLMCGGSSTAPFLCNAAGQCGCKGNSDCASATPVCQSGVCVCIPLTKTTGCQVQKVTCGTIPDGCGGTVNCNDGIQNGGETDVDCGGGITASGTCNVPCTQGKGCSATTDCSASFSCSPDKVCCNTPCTGSCSACTNANVTGVAGKSSQDGVCSAVNCGVNDPKNMCPAGSASTCGIQGNACNGNGACALYGSNATPGPNCGNPVSTTCGSPTCSPSNTTTLLGNTCTVSGNSSTCTAATTSSSCAPGQCVTTLGVGSCSSSCTGDGMCAAGAYCDKSVNPHVCTPKKGVGGACTATDQCPSGACGTLLPGVTGSGFCRATSTCKTTATCGFTGCASGSGACQYPSPNPECICSNGMYGSCDGSGTCPTAPTTNCAGNFACNTAMTSCLGACGAVGPTGDANCATGYYCDGLNGGACQQKKTAGTGCGADDQCSSGVCGINHTGNCCASSTPCKTSNATCAATGCANVAGGGLCLYPSPNPECSCAVAAGSPGTITSCDGAGTCPAAPTSPCPGNTLCQNGLSCDALCGTTAGPSTSCPSGYYCDGVFPGTCQQGKGAGIACSKGYECTGGICAGGYCCSGACTTDGSGCASCAAVTGTCSYTAAMTPCGVGTVTCVSNQPTGLDVCDGAGSCKQVAPVPTCPAGACQTTGCSSCDALAVVNDECTPYGYCNSSMTCTAKGPSGATCTGTGPAADIQCLSGHCNTGPGTCQ